MNKTTQWVVGSVVSVAVGALIAWAGSSGSVLVGGVPLFAACALLAFGVQWLGFVPSYLLQTEQHFDLTGSLTYMAVVACGLLLNPSLDVRGLLIGAFTVVWALRLGSFLFTRVRGDGHDSRFVSILPSFSQLFMTWTLQGLWVTLSLAAGLAAITTSTPQPLDLLALLGGLLWVGGFGIEVVADAQKRRFRADAANAGRFINVGLWRWSRHPNYFGEITLWAGIAVMALPVLSGWQWLTLISPLFVYVLLTRISGVPMLERASDRTWRDEPDYQRYKANTPVLMLRPPRS